MKDTRDIIEGKLAAFPRAAFTLFNSAIWEQEWSRDSACCQLYAWLCSHAQWGSDYIYESGRYRGIVIPVGSVRYGADTIAKAIGANTRTIKRALEKLSECDAIACYHVRNMLVITLVHEKASDEVWSKAANGTYWSSQKRLHTMQKIHSVKSAGRKAHTMQKIHTNDMQKVHSVHSADFAKHTMQKMHSNNNKDIKEINKEKDSSSSGGASLPATTQNHYDYESGEIYIFRYSFLEMPLEIECREYALAQEYKITCWSMLEQITSLKAFREKKGYKGGYDSATLRKWLEKGKSEGYFFQWGSEEERREQELEQGKAEIRKDIDSLVESACRRLTQDFTLPQEVLAYIYQEPLSEIKKLYAFEKDLDDDRYGKGWHETFAQCMLSIHHTSTQEIFSILERLAAKDAICTIAEGLAEWERLKNEREAKSEQTLEKPQAAGLHVAATDEVKTLDPKGEGKQAASNNLIEVMPEHEAALSAEEQEMLEAAKRAREQRDAERANAEQHDKSTPAGYLRAFASDSMSLQSFTKRLNKAEATAEATERTKKSLLAAAEALEQNRKLSANMKQIVHELEKSSGKRLLND